MTEETKTEEVETSNTPMIDAANKAAERLEKANEEQKEILARQEELMAKNALGGKAEAGETNEKKEETPAEYAKRVMSGEVENE